MYIPSNFNKIIADTFYDKEIFIVEKFERLDVEGGRSVSYGTEIGSFNGNVQFSELKKIQEEYGLRENIDIAVTNGIPCAVKVGDLIKYQGIVYEVTNAVPSDSHVLIGGKKWK